MTPEWRDTGFKSYRVSSDGHVANAGVELSPYLGKRGYYVMSFWVDGKHKTVTVHTLVCATFYGPKPAWAQVARHLNGINTDNRADNLAWGTHKQNTEDARQHGTLAQGSDNGQSKLTETQVLEICAHLDAGVALNVIEDIYGVSNSAISLINTGARWAWLTGRSDNVITTVCRTCGKEFVATTRRARYCSGTCRAEWGLQQMLDRARKDPNSATASVRRRFKEFRQ